MTTTLANQPAATGRSTTPTSPSTATTDPSLAASHAALTPLLRRITGDEKHQPSSQSTLDVIWVLYDQILRVRPDRPDAVDRDRFLLSKGHGPAAFYAVLAAKGFLPVAWLDDLAGPESPLGHHPDRLLVPGTEIGSGSLGHGLGLGVGTLLGLRAQGLTPGSGQPAGARVYVLVGDAELDEGSNHEAIAYAGSRPLGDLTVVVVDNDSATHGWPGGVASRFTVHGWTSATVEARRHGELAAALRAHDGIHPHVVVARVPRKNARPENARPENAGPENAGPENAGPENAGHLAGQGNDHA